MAGFGLRLGRSAGMEGYTGNTIEFPISASYTGKIYTGDAVKLASGLVEEATGNSGTHAGPILGIFAGCSYTEADGSIEFKNQWDGGAGRSNINAIVAIPPHGIVIIREEAGTNLTQANVGSRYGILYAAGDAATGDSRCVLGATSATGALRLVRRAPIAGNPALGAGEVTWEVSIAADELHSSDET